MGAAQAANLLLPAVERKVEPGQERTALEDVLCHPAERFVRTARVEAAEAALDAWVLAHAARAQLRSAEQKQAAAVQLRESLGLRVPPEAQEEGLELARLDGI